MTARDEPRGAYASGTCRSCRAPVRWLKTEKGASMPVDPEPVEDGNVVIDGERAIVLRKGEAGPPGLRYVAHFATCPSAAAHRARK